MLSEAAIHCWSALLTFWHDDQCVGQSNKGLFYCNTLSIRYVCAYNLEDSGSTKSTKQGKDTHYHHPWLVNNPGSTARCFSDLSSHITTRVSVIYLNRGGTAIESRIYIHVHLEMNYNHFRDDIPSSCLWKINALYSTCPLQTSSTVCLLFTIQPHTEGNNEITSNKDKLVFTSTSNFTFFFFFLTFKWKCLLFWNYYRRTSLPA